MTKQLKIIVFSIGVIITPMLFSFFNVKKTSAPISWADQKLSELTLEEKIGQFFMVAAYPAKGSAHMQEVETIVKQNKVGGIIWFPVTKENYLNYAKNFNKHLH